jgi:hypothetical protein
VSPVLRENPVPRVTEPREAWDRPDPREGPEDNTGGPILGVRYSDVDEHDLRAFAVIPFGMSAEGGPGADFGGMNSEDAKMRREGYPGIWGDMGSALILRGRSANGWKS